jgi:membrane-associated PAP2 superfamily phosphatase
MFPWLIPLIFFIALAPFTPWLDHVISGWFYNGHFVSNSFVDFFYNYGNFPGNILWAIALIIFLFSYWYAPLIKWRAGLLVLILTLPLGAGLITNVLLKDHWGRPRPKQTIEFGGKQPYRPFYSPNFFHQPEPSKSFPSGHAAMGFYFLTLGLVGWRYRNKTLFFLGIAIAVLFGGTLSIVRIAQGAHFFSDVLSSALIMWCSTLFVDRIVNKEIKREGAKTQRYEEEKSG